MTSPALLATAAALALWPDNPARTRLRSLTRGAGTARPGRRAGPASAPAASGIIAAAAAAVAMVAVAAGLGLGITAALGIVAVAIYRLACRERTYRQHQRDTAAWVAVLDTIHADVVAGTSLSEALHNARRGATGAVAAELDQAIARDALGGNIVAKLRASPMVPAQRLGDAIVLATRHGIPLADILARAAADAATHEEHAARADAALAGPRATAIILTGLPLLGVAMGQAMGARPLQLLGHGVLGGALAVAGAVCIAAGLAWTSAILRKARAC